MRVHARHPPPRPTKQIHQGLSGPPTQANVPNTIGVVGGMPPKPALRGGRRAARNGRQVRWLSGSSRAGDEWQPWQWQCEPDQHLKNEGRGWSRAPRSTDAHKTGPQDAVPSSPQDMGGESDAPPSTVKLVSAEGHLFEVPCIAVWRSSVIRGMVEDSGPGEPIPIPKATTRALSVFVALCVDQEQTLDELIPADLMANVLFEVTWVARLLEMEPVISRQVALLFERQRDEASLLHLMPLEVKLSVLEHGAKFCSPCTLSRLIDFVTETSESRAHAPSIVRSMVPHLGHRSEKVRRAAVEALQATPTLGAQLLLLTHKDFRIRMGAVKAIGELPQTAEKVQGITRLVGSDAFEIREAVANALAVASPKGDPSCMEALGRLLADHVREVREAAASALRRVALKGDPSTITAVLASVTTNDWPVQCSALRVLVDIAPDNTKMLTDLAEQLQSGNATLAKISAAKVLQGLSGKKSEGGLSDDDGPYCAGTRSEGSPSDGDGDYCAGIREGSSSTREPSVSSGNIGAEGDSDPSRGCVVKQRARWSSEESGVEDY